MNAFLSRISVTPWSGLYSLLLVWCAMAVGHSFVVLQHAANPIGMIDTSLSWSLGLAGFALVWVGMKKPETQATVLGYIGGNMIWCGWFEWTWRYTAHLLDVKGVKDTMEITAADGTTEILEMVILSPELLMIQATTLIVIAMLIFFGANKDTRCRMFMWFHRNFKLRPDTMTPGYKRQHARTTAIETVFLIWTIYLFAIFINDPRGIDWDSMTAVVITFGFVIWAGYLIFKLTKIRGLGPSFRYAIPTGCIAWLPIEAFSRWGMYPEIWIKPGEYPGSMTFVLAFLVVGLVALYKTDGNMTRGDAEPATA
jgi:hypothetical protein